MNHQPQARFWRFIGVSLGLLLALAALLWLGATSAAAQTPPVSLEVSASPAVPILPGESGLFTVTLTNNTAVTRTLVLSVTLDGPIAGSRFQPVPGESQGVTTQNTLSRDGTFLWRGELAPSGKLTMRAQARSEQTASGALLLAAAAGPALDNLLLSAQDQVTIAPSPSLGPGDLVLSQHVSDENSDLLFDTGSGVEVLSGDRVRARTVLTNNSATKVFALVTGSLRPQSINAAQASVDSCQARIVGANVGQGQGSTLPDAALSGLQADYGFLVALAPGAAAVMDMQVQAVGGIGCTLEGRIEVRARAMPAGFDGPLLPQMQMVRLLGNLPPVVNLVLLWAVLASDFGDAPDSFYWGYASGGDMLAYLTPVTAGRFPTSYYAGKPSPQGPKHNFVNPLHLGDGFSLELWADRGAQRNIDPLTLTSDLDVNDDGIDPTALSFQHCMPTTIPFRITMSQNARNQLAAEGGRAYINVWLDGNRDGDWEDWLDCDGIQAPEHIVIDQAIMPPVGGVYDLIAATANLPVPLSEVGKDMWLRITVSDAPSVKSFLTPNGIIYGDGRGPSTSFRLGETEDYLHIPAGAATGRGLDLLLESEVRMQREATIPVLNPVPAAQPAANRPFGITQRIRIRNLGDITSGGKLIVETTPFLGAPETSAGAWRGCLTCTVAASATTPPLAEFEPAQPASLSNLPIQVVCPEGETGPCRLELDLGALQPGQADELVLGWKVEEGEAVRFRTRIEPSAEDANMQNNLVDQLADAGLRPLNLLFPTPGVQAIEGVEEVNASALDWHWRVPLTSTLRFALFGQPGATVKFLANGQDVGERTLDQQGAWRGGVDVPTGDIHVEIVYKDAPGYTEEEISAFNQTGRLASAFKLTADLPFNPASLRVRPAASVQSAASNEGEVDPGLPVTDAAGAAVADGWQLPVAPGQPTALSVELFCHDEGGGAFLRIGANLFSLSNNGVSNRYSGVFDLASVEGQRAELVVGCGSSAGVQSASAGSATQEDPACNGFAECWVYEGVVEEIPTAQVVSAVDGQPVAGAVVQLWMFRRDQNGIQAESWPGAEFGQQNPLVTGADGRFGFGPTPGFYGITVAADGFQPFRAGPLRLCCHWPPDAIQLQPLPAGAPVQDISFTEGGFLRSQVQVAEGSTVRFRNLSLSFVTFGEGTAAGASQANSSRSSGLLAPGESYLTTFADAGSYRFVNDENPAQEVFLVVAEPQSPGFQLFLPITQR